MPISREPDSGGFFGDRVAAHFGMRGRQIVDFRRDGAPALAVTRLSCARRERARAAPAPAEAAFSILHQLDDLEEHACWLGGRQRYAGAFKAGTVSVDDLRDRPQCRFTGRFEALQFYVPAEALARLAEEHGARPITALRWRRDLPDRIVAGLSRALVAAADTPEANGLLVEQLSLSLLTHFAETYGGLRPAAAAERGGLAAWQARRAEETMRRRLATALTVAEVARECGLTPSHFARAFGRSFGLTPHRYLTGLRVEEAKALLAQPHPPLADIALICGFGDQSHFTRVFGRETGVSPGAWRRLRGA